jgi:hypothetical protein
MVQLIVFDSGSTAITNTPTLTLLLAKNEINFVKSLRQFEVKRNFIDLYLLLFLNISMPLKC